MIAPGGFDFERGVPLVVSQIREVGFRKVGWLPTERLMAEGSDAAVRGSRGFRCLIKKIPTGCSL